MAWIRVVWGVLLWLAAASGAWATEQGFGARLAALNSAVEAQLATEGSKPAPAEWRKVLWFNLAGVRQPSALVVLRSRRDECAVAATSAQPCRALLLAGTPEGGFRLLAEFPLLVHPVALLRSAEGVRELLYSRDMGNGPVYARYRFDGQGFVRQEGALNSDEVQRLPLLLADDLNMPLLADQLYAARQFPNDAARLAPFRLHFDAVAFSARRKKTDLYGSDYDTPVKRMLDSLRPDAQAWTAALPWPQTVELRLWSCTDWMVERRFWEVEDRRLGRLGACVEPALFAAKQGLARGDDAVVDLVRVPLLAQVGVAWLLRVAPMSSSARYRLARQEDPAELQFLGALAGQWLAVQRKQISLDRTTDALATLAKVSDQWFSLYENGLRRFVTPTPELRAFNASLAQAMRAHQCVRKLAGQPPAKALGRASCDNAGLEQARQVITWLQKDMES